MTLSSTFQLIAPMPPCIPDALGLRPTDQYVALTYEATNCMVSNGHYKYAASYWIYDALIKNIDPHLLLECKLGDDERSPTHALLLDTNEAKIYLGEYNPIMMWLKGYQDGKNQSQKQGKDELKVFKTLKFIQNKTYQFPYQNANKTTQYMEEIKQFYQQ